MTNDYFMCPSLTGEFDRDIRNGAYGYNYQYLGNSRTDSAAPRYDNFPVLDHRLRVPRQTVPNQVQYSLLDRRPENGLVEYCQRNDIRLLTYGTVAGGYLSPKYVGADESEHLASTRSLTKYRLMIEEIGGWSAFQRLLAVANDVATGLGVGVASVATRFVLDQPAVAGCVLGMTRDSHLEDALATCRLKLPDTDSDLLRTALESVHSPIGDVYGFERDRHGPHGRIMRYNLNREDG